MIIAALVSFGTLLAAWLLAPSQAAQATIEPISIGSESEPGVEPMPAAA